MELSALEFLLFNIFLCDLFFIMNDVDFASYADDNTPFFGSNDLDEVLNDQTTKTLQKSFSNGLVTTK